MSQINSMKYLCELFFTSNLRISLFVFIIGLITDQHNKKLVIASIVCNYVCLCLI